MVSVKKVFLLSLLLIIVHGCASEIPLGNNADDISFIEQPRDVSILAGDGSALSVTLYPNTNAGEGIILVSEDEGSWLEQMPLLQEEYEVLFLDKSMLDYTGDAENYLFQRRELESVFVAFHDVEAPQGFESKHFFVGDALAENVIEKIKGFINN